MDREIYYERQRLKMCQHDLFEASRPYIQIISDIYLCAAPYIILRAGGVVEQGYKFTPEQEAALSEAHHFWNEAQRSILDAYGFKDAAL